MNITLHVTPKAKSWLIDKGYDQKYGARPLRRALQSNIEDKLAEEVLDGNIRAGDKVTVSLEKNALKFAAAKPVNA